MPFYEYRCESCGHQLEALQKISEAPLTDCPECARPALIKLVSATAFQLKGNGWYATDFKGGSKANPADKGGKEAPAKEASSGSHSCKTGTCPACN